ncbi:hypothetical protein E2C01_001222 [Portunus trituberculatus]|uniref:Uncharacterized protein n=1 Tax=Portunus trituberculatus TaxID=210409 RepID=A0A5B7CIS3_PORTR|nr:hypothetical protein [Portunus trituberculatus]
MVSEGRGKPKLMVIIEISKDGDLHESIKRHVTLPPTVSRRQAVPWTVMSVATQAVTAHLSCNMETFGKFTTSFDDKFTEPPELIQTRTGQTRTSPEQN